MNNFFFPPSFNSSWHKRSLVLQICHEFAWDVFQLPAHFPGHPPSTVFTQHCLAVGVSMRWFQKSPRSVKDNVWWQTLQQSNSYRNGFLQPAAPASITESQTCRGWKGSFTPAPTLLLPSSRYQMHHSAPDWTNTSSHLPFSVRTLRCHRRCRVCQILICQTLLSISFSKSKARQNSCLHSKHLLFAVAARTNW